MEPDGDEQRRLLLVDDEEALVWSLSNRLMRARPRLIVETAPDGEVALANLRRTPADLLIADVRMPGMSGTDLVLAARRLVPELPVIIMTAFKTADIQEFALESCTSFLEKPFEFDRLLAMVDEYLARPTLGFSGAISVQTLPDIVQLYALSAQTGSLRVRRHAVTGEVFFQQGQITHAQTSRGLMGEAAFHEVMMWSGGEFSTHIGPSAPARTIRTSWTELLMESCRLIDERRREIEETGGRPSSSRWTLAPPVSEAEFAEPVVTDAFELGFPEDPPTSSQAETLPQVTPTTYQEPIMNVKESLAKLNNIDGFVGAALVDSESGMLLGQEGGGPLNLEIAAAGNTEVVRAKRKTMANLNVKDGIEDILITLTKQYHLIRPLRSRPSVFFYLALDRQRANLAMARIALADVEKDLTL